MLKQLTDSNHRPTHEEIAKIAYAIFEKNGKIPGKDQENWLEAEAQLMAARRPAQTRQAASTPSKSTANMAARTGGSTQSRSAARDLVNH
jgi:hypothetical protein